MRRTFRILIYSFLFIVFLLIIYFYNGFGYKSTFSEKEIQWIKQNDSVKVLVGYSAPPDMYLNTDGEWEGMWIDYQEAVEENLGFELQYEPVGTWDSLIKYAFTKNNFVIVGIARTNEREKYLNFTNTLYRFEYVIVGRQDQIFDSKEDLKNYTVCTPANYAINDYLEDYYPEIKPVHYINDLKCLQAVSLGQADFAILNQMNVSYLVQTKAITNLRVIEDIGYTNRLCAAVSKKDPVLFSIIDKAVANVTVSRRDHIYQKWIKVDNKWITKKTGTILVIGLVILSLGLIFTWVIINILRRQVAKQTQELRIAKEKAEESDKLKSSFLANMSHEIRTPMNGILGFADLLLKPNVSKEKQEKYLNIINESGVRMLSTINDIIDISRIESGEVILDEAEVDLEEMIDYFENFFRIQADKKGIDFDYEPGYLHSRFVIGDKEKIYAILSNLLRNAIKFTDKGKVSFIVVYQNEQLIMEVKDTGVGIAKDKHEAIFNRFIMADLEDRDNRQGSGLGLSICKAYVDLMNGQIRLQSVEGEGSIFTVTIPIKASVSH